MPPSTITTTPPDLRRFRQVGQVANHLAMAALLQAHNLLSLATGRHLREARAQEDPPAEPPGPPGGGRAEGPARLGGSPRRPGTPGQDPGATPPLLLPGPALPHRRDQAPPGLDPRGGRDHLPRLPEHHLQLGGRRRSRHRHRRIHGQAGTACGPPLRRRPQPGQTMRRRPRAKARAGPLAQRLLPTAPGAARRDPSRGLPRPRSCLPAGAAGAARPTRDRRPSRAVQDRRCSRPRATLPDPRPGRGGVAGSATGHLPLRQVRGVVCHAGHVSCPLPHAIPGSTRREVEIRPISGLSAAKLPLRPNLGRKRRAGGYCSPARSRKMAQPAGVAKRAGSSRSLAPSAVRGPTTSLSIPTSEVRSAKPRYEQEAGLRPNTATLRRDGRNSEV